MSFFVVLLLGVESRFSHVLGKHSTTELGPQPLNQYDLKKGGKIHSFPNNWTEVFFPFFVFFLFFPGAEKQVVQESSQNRLRSRIFFLTLLCLGWSHSPGGCCLNVYSSLSKTFWARYVSEFKICGIFERYCGHALSNIELPKSWQYLESYLLLLFWAIQSGTNYISLPLVQVKFC